MQDSCSIKPLYPQLTKTPYTFANVTPKVYAKQANTMLCTLIKALNISSMHTTRHYLTSTIEWCLSGGNQEGKPPVPPKNPLAISDIKPAALDKVGEFEKIAHWSKQSTNRHCVAVRPAAKWKTFVMLSGTHSPCTVATQALTYKHSQSTILTLYTAHRKHH